MEPQRRAARGSWDSWGPLRHTWPGTRRTCGRGLHTTWPSSLEQCTRPGKALGPHSGVQHPPPRDPRVRPVESGCWGGGAMQEEGGRGTTATVPGTRFRPWAEGRTRAGGSGGQQDAERKRALCTVVKLIAGGDGGLLTPWAPQGERGRAVPPPGGGRPAARPLSRSFSGTEPTSLPRGRRPHHPSAPNDLASLRGCSTWPGVHPNLESVHAGRPLPGHTQVGRRELQVPPALGTSPLRRLQGQPPTPQASRGGARRPRSSCWGQPCEPPPNLAGSQALPEPLPRRQGARSQLPQRPGL